MGGELSSSVLSLSFGSIDEAGFSLQKEIIKPVNSSAKKIKKVFRISSPKIPLNFPQAIKTRVDKYVILNALKIYCQI
jgi:hypothetical protein